MEEGRRKTFGLCELEAAEFCIYVYYISPKLCTRFVHVRGTESSELTKELPTDGRRAEFSRWERDGKENGRKKSRGESQTRRSRLDICENSFVCVSLISYVRSIL